MTVKQFSEVAAGRIYLNDFEVLFPPVPVPSLDALKDCKICEIESRGGDFEITLEKQLVRE